MVNSLKHFLFPIIFKIHFLPHRKHTVSTIKKQPRNAIKGNYRYCFREMYKTHKYTLYTKCTYSDVKMLRHTVTS